MPALCTTLAPVWIWQCKWLLAPDKNIPPSLCQHASNTECGLDEHNDALVTCANSCWVGNCVRPFVYFPTGFAACKYNLQEDCCRYCENVICVKWSDRYCMTEGKKCKKPRCAEEKDKRDDKCCKRQTWVLWQTWPRLENQTPFYKPVNDMKRYWRPQLRAECDSEERRMDLELTAYSEVINQLFHWYNTPVFL